MIAWKTARTPRLTAIAALALGTPSCGGHAQGEAEPEKHELLVLDALDQPAPRVRALVAGQVVTTDDEGRAELGELPARYDAVLVAGSSVLAYQGLEARSPTIKCPNSYLSANEHEAKVSMARVNVAPDQSMFYAVGVTGENISRQTMGYNSDDKSSWGFIDWSGPSDVTLSAHAFLAELDPQTGSVIGYSGYASRTWPSTNQPFDVNWTPQFEVSALKTSTIHVEVKLPANTYVSWYSTSIQLASGESGPIGTSYAGVSADLIVPDLPGATFDVYATLVGPDNNYQVAAMHHLTAGSTVHAEGSNNPQLLTPEDGQTKVTPETDFSWSASPGDIYELIANDDSSTQPLHYLVATTATSAQLPDTSALGLPFPSGITLRWFARSEHGYASLDDYAAGLTTVTGTGFSSLRQFTTAP